jgi:hypothetical protein
MRAVAVFPFLNGGLLNAPHFWPVLG